MSKCHSLRICSRVLLSLLCWAFMLKSASADVEANNQSSHKGTRVTSGWPLHGGDHGEQRFSKLTQINDKNINKLGLVWYADVLSIDGLLATPIVVDGIIYLSSTFANVFAFDAKTGEEIWHFDPQVRLDTSIIGSWASRVNRGVAFYEGKVFVGTGDCRLIAIDADKGTKIWETLTCDPLQNYGVTGAPRVAGNKIFIGNGSSDMGVRGYVTAYDTSTGKQLWRFWTVPGDPELGFENDAMAMAAKTWTGNGWWKNGGGAAWDSLTYDPDFNHLYIGTDSALPWDTNVRSPEGGDNLFLNSIVAVDADTGEYKWHYQTVPADAWDYNANNQMTLADLEIDGKKRKVLMQAPKNGFFYVIDRKDGKLVSANNYVRVNWASGIDIKTGRPIENPEARYYLNHDGRARVYPSIWGAHNWHPMSYSPLTGLVYIPAQDLPTTYRLEKDAMLGGVFIDLYGYQENDPDRPQKLSKLVAWDPVTQTERWSVQDSLPFNGGVLSTAGKLVFEGTATGHFNAFNADSGKKLWSVKVGSAMRTGPVSYSIEGEQYILAAVGWGGASRFQAPQYGATQGARGPSRLFAFKLGGDAAMPTFYKPDEVQPKPPQQFASKETIERGAVLFEVMVCSLCHGQDARGAGGGSVPDLRYMTAETHEQWQDIVLGGIRKEMGMLSFSELLSVEDADAIRAFVIEQAHELYDSRHAEK